MFVLFEVFYGFAKCVWGRFKSCKFVLFVGGRAFRVLNELIYELLNVLLSSCLMIVSGLVFVWFRVWEFVSVDGFSV